MTGRRMTLDELDDLRDDVLVVLLAAPDTPATRTARRALDALAHIAEHGRETYPNDRAASSGAARRRPGLGSGSGGGPPGPPGRRSGPDAAHVEAAETSAEVLTAPNVASSVPHPAQGVRA